MSSWRNLLNSSSWEVPPHQHVLPERDRDMGRCLFFMVELVLYRAVACSLSWSFNCQFPVKACFFSSCLKEFACPFLGG